MKLTEEQFVNGLTADQIAYFNGRLIEIRNQFQVSYAESLKDVAAAKDQLLSDCQAALKAETEIAATVPSLTSERDAALAQVDGLQSQVDTIPALNQQIASLTAEVARLTQLVPPPVDPNEVPVFVTSMQGRLALLKSGLLKTVDATVAEASEDVQIFWEYASEWHRNNPVLIGLGTSLGLSETDVDNLFRLAGSLS